MDPMNHDFAILWITIFVFPKIVTKNHGHHSCQTAPEIPQFRRVFFVRATFEVAWSVGLLDTDGTRILSC